VRDDTASGAVWAATETAISDQSTRLDLSTITPGHAPRLARAYGSSVSEECSTTSLAPSIMSALSRMRRG